MDAQKIINYLERVGILLFLLFSLTAGREILLANDILPENTASSENNLIVKTAPSGKSDRPAVYNLKRWIVEENTNPVKRALEVYKKKSEARYVKHIWITDKKDGKRRMIVEYTPRGSDDKIIFSQDEDFMYYLGITPGGENIVYGVNLLSEKKFSLGAAQDFNMVRCPDKKNYLVVQEGRQRSVYQIYTVTGQKMKTVTNIQDPVDIEKSLCH